MAVIDYISTRNSPLPSGHYSQATSWQDLLFISGQLPVSPDGTHLCDEPFEVQARQALENVISLLGDAGTCLRGLAQMRAYIVGAENWRPLDTICAEMLADTKPARIVVPVAQLHHGYLIEIEAIAVRMIVNASAQVN